MLLLTVITAAKRSSHSLCPSFSLAKKRVKKRGYLAALLGTQQVQIHEREICSENRAEGVALTVLVVLCLPDNLHVVYWPLYVTRISTSLSPATASRVLLVDAHSIFISCEAFSHLPSSPPFSSFLSESKPFGSQFYYYSHQAITGCRQILLQLARTACESSPSQPASVTSSHLSV